MGEATTAAGAARNETPTARLPGREALAPYARPHLGRGLLDLATSVVPYLGLLLAIYFALDVSLLRVSARSRGTAALKEPPIIPAEGREPALLVASRKLRKT